MEITMGQPEPVKNKRPAVWDIVVHEMGQLSLANPQQRDIITKVIADIEARDKNGIAKYGTRLQPFNGRDALWDAYEEALDKAVYTRQALYEAQDQRIVTEEQKNLVNALGPLYMQAIEHVMRYRFLIAYIKKEIVI